VLLHDFPTAQQYVIFSQVVYINKGFEIKPCGLWPLLIVRLTLLTQQPWLAKPARTPQLVTAVRCEEDSYRLYEVALDFPYWCKDLEAR